MTSRRIQGPNNQVGKLKKRLAAAEEALAAIRDGQVDAVLISDSAGERMLTLAGAENGYRIFVEAMREGAVTIGADSSILYCNRGFADLVSRPLEQLIGSSFLALVAPGHEDFMKAALSPSPGRPSRAELSLLSADGTEIPVFLSVTTFEEYGSQVLCAVVTDLREQKRQAELLAAGKLTRLLVDQALEAVAVCDSSGRVILASRALHKLCDCNPLFQQLDAVLRLDSTADERHTDPLKEILRGRRFHAYEVLASPARDGEARHMLLSAGPMILPDASAKGYVITLFDIEERKRAEDALRQSERLAATGRLAATIAHEINNPLEAVTNLLYLAVRTPNLPEVVGEYLRMAETELMRVAHITRQTLAFHRHSQQPEPIPVAELLDSVMFLYARRAMMKQVEITREIGDAGTIVAYAGELRQVISNLFANALEACPVGGRLRLRAYATHEHGNSHKPGVRIVLADNGSGIARENVERIFEPFYTTKGEKGSGLGLWVSQSIVAKHGGYIRLRSSTRPSRSGTVFSIFLPLPEEQPQQQAASAD